MGPGVEENNRKYKIMVMSDKKYETHKCEFLRTDTTKSSMLVFFVLFKNYECLELILSREESFNITSHDNQFISSSYLPSI